MSLPVYSEKYSRKKMEKGWPTIFIGRRWTDKIRSLSIRRKFQFVVDGRDAEESSYRWNYWNTPCSLSLSLSTTERERVEGGSIRRIITVETFTPFGIPWEKHSIPERRKCGEAKEREAVAVVWSVKKSRGTSSFSISAPLCPFHGGLREKVGSLLLLSPVTVYSDFHPVFFTRSLLCFSNLPTPASSNNCYSTPPLAKQFAERAHLVSRPRDPTTTGNFLPLLSFETAIPLSPRSESNRFSTLCSLFATSLRLVARSRISA